MDYVNESAAARAQDFEKRLQQLPTVAGILFVSVKAVLSATGDSKMFEVHLGVRKDVLAGSPLVRLVFQKEIEQGLTFLVSAYQGVSGAARDYDGDEKTSTTSSEENDCIRGS